MIGSLKSKVYLLIPWTPIVHRIDRRETVNTRSLSFFGLHLFVRMRKAGGLGGVYVLSVRLLKLNGHTSWLRVDAPVSCKDGLHLLNLGNCSGQTSNLL